MRIGLGYEDYDSLSDEDDDPLTLEKFKASNFICCFDIYWEPKMPKETIDTLKKLLSNQFCLRILKFDFKWNCNLLFTNSNNFILEWIGNDQLREITSGLNGVTTLKQVKLDIRKFLFSIKISFRSYKSWSKRGKRFLQFVKPKLASRM